MSAAALIGGYGADLALGDPRRYHPVAGLGALAAATERRLYAPTRARGVAYTAAIVGASVLAARLAESLLGRRAALALTTYTALGGRSLATRALGIARHLEAGDVETARGALPALAGRDAQTLDAEQISRAVIESVAENTADAVVGALAWAVLAGAPGVAAYRAANTLDAMVGHRSDRYRQFGWASARLDDALGWAPARLAAALAVACAPIVAGDPAQAWRTLRADGARHPSPNAGRLEAAFAGALGVRLGGALAYDGRPETRPDLNAGARPPRPGDIRRAVRLSLAVGLAAATLAALAAARAPAPTAVPAR